MQGVEREQECYERTLPERSRDPLEKHKPQLGTQRMDHYIRIVVPPGVQAKELTVHHMRGQVSGNQSPANQEPKTQTVPDQLNPAWTCAFAVT